MMAFERNSYNIEAKLKWRTNNKRAERGRREKRRFA